MHDPGIICRKRQKRIGIVLGISLLFALGNIPPTLVRGQLGAFTRLQDVGHLKYLTTEYNNTQTGPQFGTNSTETYDITTSQTGRTEFALLIAPLSKDSQRVTFYVDNDSRHVSISTNDAIVPQNYTELFLGKEQGNLTIDANVGELGILYKLGRTSTFHYDGAASGLFQGSSIDVLAYRANLEFLVAS